MAYLQHTAPTEGNKENLSLVRGMSLTLASMGMTINRAMVSVVVKKWYNSPLDVMFHGDNGHNFKKR